ncbi:hypothetical protein, partial [Klebsiella michiganensis]|uniref:hypothetical protein n=1 Tax=Klebsiella michiganensis TaxID=1134687 RepID=UPI001BD4972F
TLAPLLAEMAYERMNLDSLNTLLADRLEFIDRFGPPDALSRCACSSSRSASCGISSFKAWRAR